MRVAGRAADGARYLVPLLLVWGLPLLVLVWVSPGGLERASLFPDDGEQREVVVGRRTEDGRQSVALELTWSGSRVVVWPDGEAVVTEVMLPRGRPLVDGDPLLAVDGVMVVAQSSGVPLWRDVELGMSGSDVDWVDELLVAAGLAADSTLDDAGRATAETGQSVRAWQQAAGVARPDGVFARQFTVFVGADAVVDEVMVALGDPLASGAELFATTPVLVGLEATLTGPAERHRLVRDVAVVVTIDGSDVELASLSVSGLQLERIAERVPAGVELVEALPVRRAEPIAVGVVPSSAVVMSHTSAARCVVVVSSTGSREVVPIADDEIVAAEAGVAYVDEHLAGEQVVSNPTTGDSAACV